MRFLLLLSVTCVGYAMENQTINEGQLLIGVRQENPIRNAAQHCCDHHGGTLVMCSVLTCIGGFVGIGCWHAGGVGAAKSAGAIAQIME
jgi:hypothetical protein